MSAGMTKNIDWQVGLEMGWHGKTEIVPVITKLDAIKYGFEKRRNYILDPQGNPIIREVPIIDEKTGEETGAFETDSVLDTFSIVTTDNDLPVGGTVKRGYRLITDEMVWDMIDQSLSGTGYSIVSFGTCKRRSKCYASIQLSKDNVIAGGRETKNLLNVLWGHGGVFQVMARSGFIVIVCQNTFNMALSTGGEFTFAMKHTGNAVLKLENMSKAIDNHFGVTAEFKAAMDSLSATPCNATEAKELFAGFVVRGEGTAELKVEEISTRSSNIIDTMQSLFRTGLGNDGNDFSDCFNALTDYYSHESSGGDNRYKQFESSEFGAGQRAKTEAYSLLTGRTVPKLGDLATVISRGSKVLQLI